MTFCDVRKRSPFSDPSLSCSQRTNDLGLQASVLLIQQRRQAFWPRHGHRFPGQTVRKREAEFEAVGATLDVLHASHQSMVL
jgi:hypothetical protein